MENYKQTSREAWRGFLPTISATLDLEIMAALESRPMTCQEVEEITGRSHQAVSGNLRHLVEKGHVEHSGGYGQTTSGRRAMLWRISERRQEAA